MTKYEGRRRSPKRRRPNSKTYNRQAQLNMLGACLTTKNHPHTIYALRARVCDRCLRQSPRLTRHVDCPDGRGLDLCRLCVRWLAGDPAPVQTRAQAAARSRWRELFRLSCPRVACGLGGRRRAQVLILTPPAATPARIVFANFAETGLERRGTWRG